MMNKKSVTRLLALVLGIFCLSLVFSQFVPAFINQTIITKKIVRELSQKLNAEVKIEHAALSLLPSPRVSLHEMTLAFGDRAVVNIAEVQLLPALLPLLAGTLQPASIRITAPHLSLSVPSVQTAASGRWKDVTVAHIQKRAAESIRELVKKAPLRLVAVSGGEIRINAGDTPKFSFSNVSAHLNYTAGRTSIAVSSSSNIWKKVALQAEADINEMRFEGTVSFSGLDLSPIRDTFFPADFAIGNSSLDGEGSFSADTSGLAKACFNVSIPYLTIKGQEETRLLRGELHKVEILSDPRTTSIAIDGAFASPRLNVSGTCTIDAAHRCITLEGRGINMELDSCAEFAGALFKHQPLIQEISNRVKGGVVSDASFTVQGPLGSDIVGMKTIVLQGRVSSGRIAVPEAEANVENVSAEFTAQDGVLAVKNIQAQCDQSRIQDGVVQIDLARLNRPIFIDTQFTGDVSQLPRILKFLPATDVSRELSLVQNPQGTCNGQLTIRDIDGSYEIRVVITELTLLSRYRSFPMPLKLSKGICVYHKGILSFPNISGRLGRSTVHGVTALFNLDHDLAFRIAARDATVFLDELHMALSSFPATKQRIHDITRSTGMLSIQSLDITGPLRSPRQWKFTLQGEAREVTLDSPQLEGAATVKKAALKMNQDVFSMSSVQAHYLDSTIEGSCSINGYLQGLNNLKLSARGTLGQKSVLRIMDVINAPSEIVPQGPLRLGQTQLVWAKDSSTSFSSDFSCASGGKISVSLQAMPHTLDITKLQIRDQDSEAVISIGIQKNLFNVTFLGNIEKTTADRVLANNQLIRGRIRGDMTARIDQNNPQRSFASGTLAWNDVALPIIDSLPLLIARASVTGMRNKLLIHDAEMIMGPSRGIAQGSIEFGDAYILDLQLDSERVDLHELRAMLAPDDGKGGADTVWEMPLRGTVVLAAKSLSAGPLEWNPFQARITFGDKNITITVADSRVCSIETPGTIVMTPAEVHLSAQPAIQNASAKKVIQCLSGERALVSGRITLHSDLSARGTADNVLNNLNGNLSIVARKGHIYRSNLLTNILSFLSIRNLLLGKKADITQKGFAYRTLSINGEFHGDTFRIREGILDSNTLSLACEGTYKIASKRLDLTVLATPFQIYDLLLMSIPVVGMVFGRTLVGVPIRVTGTLDEPKLGPGNPAAIPRNMVGIFKNMVKLPIRIIEPMMPQKDAEHSK